MENLQTLTSRAIEQALRESKADQCTKYVAIQARISPKTNLPEITQVYVTDWYDYDSSIYRATNGQGENVE